MQSYSQFGQDLWVLSLFPNKKGFFVDIGCCDGERISNTFLLDSLGWYGIAADPFPVNFTRRTNTVLEKIAIYSSDTSLDFAKAGDIGGFVKNLDRWKDDGRVTNAEIVKQEAITLEKLLDKYQAPNYIEYLSLDTEGSEYEILKSFPFHKYTFGCLTIEHNREELKRQKIQELLYQHNYTLNKHDDVEDYYTHNKVNII